MNAVNTAMRCHRKEEKGRPERRCPGQEKPSGRVDGEGTPGLLKLPCGTQSSGRGDGGEGT